MSPNPRRDTPAGRVFNDLRNKARREGRPTDDLITLYVLERFLYRLSRSDLVRHFVLKGGLVLALFDARRATRDADLLGRGLPSDEQEIVAHVGRIAAIHADDGVEFDVQAIRTAPIREDGGHGGLRIALPARLGRARAVLRLDISFGDPITPEARLIRYPQHLGGASFSLLTYPVETMLAEKVVTAVLRGDGNTRDRDFADVWRLTGLNDLSGKLMRRALERTARHRNAVFYPLSEGLGILSKRRTSTYAAWRRKQGPDGAAYPEEFGEVLAGVVRFADPLLADEVSDATWQASSRSWTR